jgi:hypothetical protein
MAKDPKDRPKPQTPTPAPKTPANASPAAETPKKRELNRLTINLDDNDRPDFSAMRDKTRDKLKQLIQDPTVAKELGIAPDASAPPVVGLPPFVTRAAVRMLSQLDTLIVARVTQAPPAIVLAVAPYTPEEEQAIAEPLENILNKYGGKLLTKWGDEIALAGMLTMITMTKIEAVRAAMNVRPPAPVVVHPSSAPQPPAPAPEPPADQLPPEVIQ